MALNAYQLATLKHLSASGDMTAKALIQGNNDMRVSVATKVGNNITVSIWVNDKAANLYLTSVPVSGAGTMAIGANGTLKAGSASKAVWAQPAAATGRLDIVVTNAVAEQNLLMIESSSGDAAMVVLQY